MRERILNIAFKHFTKYTYSKTTITAIAEELGIKKSAIYYYFKNKEAILRAIIQLEAENLNIAISTPFEKNMSQEEVMVSYIEKRVNEMHQVSERYKKLKQELFMLLPHIESIRAPFLVKEISLVQDCVQRGVSSGEFSIEHPAETASALVYALKGLEIPMYVSDQVSHSEKELKSLISLFMNGIKSTSSC